jgi:hypothetical protein
MQETKSMADEARRTGHQVQEQFQKAGKDYQQAVEGGFEAATRSFGEMNRGFQAIAAEVTAFSKGRFEDTMQAWDQIVRARSFSDIVEAQSKYAQKAFDAYMSEISKLGDMYLGTARNAAKPFEQTPKRLT